MTDLPFIKKFDIRGVYGEDITDENAFYIAKAVVKILPIKKVLIGWDTRVSSKSLAMHMIAGFGNEVDVSYIDMCPTEYITAAAYAMDYDLCIACTGSHNILQWTGILLHTKGGESIRDELMQKLAEEYIKSVDGSFTNDVGVSVDLTLVHNALDAVEDIFYEKLTSFLPSSCIKQCCILVDIADSPAFRLIDNLEKLYPQIHIDRICDRRIYDALSHPADPSIPENMSCLVSHIQDKHYDAGFSVDSDADRVLATDHTGKILNGSLLAGALVLALLSLGSDDKKFGYAVECGPSFYNACIDLQKTYTDISIEPVPVGRSIIRGKLRDGSIDFGVENVGHFYTKDFFKTDSSLFSMLLIIYYIGLGNKLCDLCKIHPDGIRVMNISLPLGSNIDLHIDDLYSQMHVIYPDMRKVTVDGERGEIFSGAYMTGWFCLRHSGYEHKAKDYYGSIIQDQFQTIDYLIKKFSS